MDLNKEIAITHSLEEWLFIAKGLNICYSQSLTPMLKTPPNEDDADFFACAYNFKVELDDHIYGDV
jgi:hypothetical protein